MSITFRRMIANKLPAWLRSGEGGLVAYTLAWMLDAFRDRARLAIFVRFPQWCPPDALAPHGRDRGIVRGIYDTDESYAARLIPWLDYHKRRGNPWAMLEQLQAYCGGVMVRTVDRRGNWFTIAADGTQTYTPATGTWIWDSTAASPEWARGWVIIYCTNGVPFSEGPKLGDTSLWGGAIGTEGYTIGSTATPGQIAALRAIVEDGRPAGFHAEWIILAFDPASFNPTSPEPDASWAGWAKGSPAVASRLSTARYIPAVR